MAKEVLDDLIVSYDIESFCEIDLVVGFAINLSKKRKFNQIVLIDPILEKNKEVKKVINDQVLQLIQIWIPKKLYRLTLSS